MDEAAQAVPGTALFPAGLIDTITFDDFDAMAAAARGWEQDYIKLGAGKFRGEIRMAHTARMQLATANWSCGILSEGAVPRGGRTFGLIVGAGGPARHGGIPVGPSDIATLTDRDELHFLHPGGCRIYCLTLGHDVIESVAATFLGTGWDDGIGCARVLPLRDAAGVAQGMGRLLEACFIDSTALQDPAYGAALERAAGAAVLARLDLPVHHVAAARRRQLARRAEDYLRANANRSVTIAELCAAVGVPERTLHEACREYFGLPPIAFLRVLRLHGVRRRLLCPDKSTSVTEAATAWGFFHFGEFAAAYRRLFGEVPSETLRRHRPPPVA